jgi:hypothetical protein
MDSALDKTILELLETREAYAPDGLLRYGTWQPIAEILNRRGFRTPVDQAWWTSKSLANYYRRHLRDNDERLKPSTTQ